MKKKSSDLVLNSIKCFCTLVSRWTTNVIFMLGRPAGVSKWESESKSERGGKEGGREKWEEREISFTKHLLLFAQNWCCLSGPRTFNRTKGNCGLSELWTMGCSFITRELPNSNTPWSQEEREILEMVRVFKPHRTGLACSFNHSMWSRAPVTLPFKQGPGSWAFKISYHRAMNPASALAHKVTFHK